jgi:hypothetical protein
MTQSIRRFAFLLTIAVVGCGTHAAPLHPFEPPPEPPPELGTQFDATQTGAIRGRILWVSESPVSTGFRNGKIGTPSQAASFDANNPLMPRINSQNHGVAEAVIFLRKVDPQRSRQWSLSRAQVEMGQGTIAIRQGEGRGVTGIVHTSDELAMISHGPNPEMLRARGAAFFTLAFPEPERELRRRLDRPGLVELSSAASNFQARSWIFVSDHPYFAHSSADGHFTLDQVPDGTYELVCWLPNWKPERFERDPENQNIARLWYAQPLEKSMTVRVEKGAIVEADFTVSALEFPSARKAR